jgi:hypothetical protein
VVVPGNGFKGFCWSALESFKRMLSVVPSLLAKKTFDRKTFCLYCDWQIKTFGRQAFGRQSFGRQSFGRKVLCRQEFDRQCLVKTVIWQTSIWQKMLGKYSHLADKH